MASSSFWCYQCTRVLPRATEDALVCPHCRGGFIQAMGPAPRQFVSNTYNPIVVLRPPVSGTGYGLFYHDRSGSGLRPLPPTVSESLFANGFGRLCQFGFSEWARPETLPATDHAIASLRTVQVVESDVECAVCMDAFALGSEAREMPCKHMYHSDCITPWLHLHRSCPVCRHQLPGGEVERVPEPIVGLSIWRLPDGGFAVGRFAGGMVFRRMRAETPRPETEWWRRFTPRRGAGLRRFLGSMFRRRRATRAG